MPSTIVALVEGATLIDQLRRSGTGSQIIPAEPQMIEKWANSHAQEFPSKLILQVGAVRIETLLRIVRNAALTGCHLQLLTRFCGTDVAEMLRLLTLAPANCLVMRSSEGVLSECATFSDNRISVRALVLRALATRIGRLPSGMIETVTLGLLCSGPIEQPARPPYALPLRSLTRRLADVGLASPGRLQRVSRMGFAWDFLRDNSVSRGRLAQVSGFTSERTLSAAVVEILGMSLRDSEMALDDTMVADRLVAHCLRR